jgi:hypothetical protein
VGEALMPPPMKGYTSDSYAVQILKLLGWLGLGVVVGHFLLKYW